MSPGERFLVLGATGFFGSHITEELRTAGQEVVPAARDGVKGP
ncbi:MAG: SDR family oxidoreductase, partial [Solirubrobacterales bacterium]|nr:SDR family oxidoreductase [Solirubrobacterales bacterium]